MREIVKLSLAKPNNYEWSTVLFDSDTGKLIPMLSIFPSTVFRDENGRLILSAVFEVENLELNGADSVVFDSCGELELIKGVWNVKGS